MKTWNDVSPTWRKILKFISLVILAAGAAILFSRCNAEKQAARKDERYINYVNASAKRQIPVVNAWKTANPQDSAVKIIISEPKLITVYNEKLVKDTTGKQRLIDSVKHAHEKEIDCGKAAIDAFDLGYEQAEKYYLDNPIKVKCPPDTTKQYTLLSEIRRWQDTNTLKSLQLAAYNGTLSEVRDNLSNQKKDTNKWEWYFWFSIAGLVLSHVIRTYAGGWISSFTGMFKKK